jgi:16S rRNA (guanine527-N7)-methyltransferase
MSPDRHWDPLLDLSEKQRMLIEEFERLLRRASRRVNLVSRSSVREMRQVHSRNSLMLSARAFPAGSTVVDWGTGGGLPGIPLAIRFDDVGFVLVDSIGKKAALTRAIAARLGLTNVAVVEARAENFHDTCDFAVSRATASLVDLWTWTKPCLRKQDSAGTPVPEHAPDSGPRLSFWSPGLLALKGGDFRPELADLQKADPNVAVEVTALRDLTGVDEGDKYIVSVRPGEET